MNRLGALALVLFVLAMPRAHGQAEAVKEDAVHAELRAQLREITVAYNAGDIDKLVSYLDDNCVVTWPNAAVNRGAKQVKEYLQATTQGPHRVIDKAGIELVTNSLSVMYDGNTMAVAHGRSLDHFKLTEGAEYNQWTTWTATLIKKDGSWKIASLHMSTNMFDNPVVALVFKRTAWWVGGIVAVVALLLGFVSGWVVGSRRSPRSPKARGETVSA